MWGSQCHGAEIGGASPVRSDGLWDAAILEMLIEQRCELQPRCSEKSFPLHPLEVMGHRQRKEDPALGGCDPQSLTSGCGRAEEDVTLQLHVLGAGCHSCSS